jgi:isopenicillin-N epimerase
VAASIQGVEVSWDRARDLFSLDPALSQLNHGSFGAVPIPVQRAQRRLREEMEANPVSFFTRGLTDRLGHVRRHIAGFVGADPDGTALISNTTAGVEIVLSSIGIREGDEILLTDHGYGAVALAAQRLRARTGAVVREVALPITATDDEVIDRIVSAVRRGRTRLAIVDQVTSPTARLMPVSELAAAMRELGVAVLVDGAHAPGMLPLDVDAIRADFWVGNLHKWAFAPRPTAVLVAAPEHRGSIEPLVVSFEQPRGYPAAVEYGGTLDYTAWLAAPTGIHLMRTLGLERLRRHNGDLADNAQRAVAAAVRADPAELVRSEPVSMRIVPLPPGIATTQPSALAVRDRLFNEYGCEVQVGPWRDRGYIRVSAQIYNTEADIDRLARACEAVVGHG